MPRARIYFPTVVVLLVFVGAPVKAQTPVTATYVGPIGGDWANAANWTTTPNTGNFPQNGGGPDYRYTVTLGTNASLALNPTTTNVSNLTQTGNLLIGSANRNLFIDNVWTVTAGGAGIFGSGANVLTASAGTMNINDFFTIQNATLNGGSNINLNAGGMGNGGGTGTLNVGSGQLNVNMNDGGTFVAVSGLNQINITGLGQIVRATGTGTATLSASQITTTSGTLIDVQTGTLRVDSGNVTWGCSAVMSAGARLLFSVGTYNMNGSSGGGAGTWEIAAGVTLTNSAFYSTNAATILRGNIDGTGPVSFNGHLTWAENAGMLGTGTTDISGGALIVGNGSADLRRTVNNFSGAATPVILRDNGIAGIGAVWNNRSGSVFIADGTTLIYNSSAPTSVFNNNSNATFRKTGTGTCDIGWTFTNDGTVDVQQIAGTTFFSNYTQSSTGLLKLSGGSIVFAVNAAAVTSVQGSIDGTGTIQLGNGTNQALQHANGQIIPGGISAIGTLAFLGELRLAPTSILNFTLGTASDLITTGRLTLDGTLVVNAGPGFGAGTYILFDYNDPLSGNGLTDNGLDFGNLPVGYDYSLSIDEVNDRVLLNVTPTPEPTGGLAVAVGMGLCLGWAHRRFLQRVSRTV